MGGLPALAASLGALWALTRGAKPRNPPAGGFEPPPDPDLPGETPLPGYPANPVTVARVLQYRQSIADAAERWELHPTLIAGVIAVESSGRPVQNPQGGGAGAWGLMQIRQAALMDYNQLRDTAFTLQDLVDTPALGVEVGTCHLKTAIRNMGTQYDGLRAYKVGVTGARGNDDGRDYARLVQNVAVPAFVREGGW